MIDFACKFENLNFLIKLSENKNSSSKIEWISNWEDFESFRNLTQIV